MGTSRNPGMLAVIAGVALAVLFALLGLTTVLPGQTAFALAIVALVLAALLYVFYSRGNVIEKTGYGALLLIIATAFILPLLLINQQQAQATQTSTNYTLTLQRGAALFGQQCARCHGYQGQGIIGPRLNNSPVLAKLKTTTSAASSPPACRNRSTPPRSTTSRCPPGRRPTAARSPTTTSAI